jgi:hypothetical protein
MVRFLVYTLRRKFVVRCQPVKSHQEQETPTATPTPTTSSIAQTSPFSASITSSVNFTNNHANTSLKPESVERKHKSNI